METEVIEWLLDGDPAICYQTRRDLLGEDGGSASMRAWQARIATEGWGKAFLDAQNPDGSWARGFYQPKWTSTHYTLLDLRLLEAPRTLEACRIAINDIAAKHKSEDGGINPAGTIKEADVCINGMFMTYGCYFGIDAAALGSVVDFVLSQQLPDGGWNCRYNRSGARHSSMHSTLSVLEGIAEYIRRGYSYRGPELEAAADAGRGFLLMHRLYKSDRTGQVIHPSFLTFAFPPRWKYNVLRALDYFRLVSAPWDDRMSHAVAVVKSKRKPDGRWPVQAAHPGQVHFVMEKGRSPSRWNTLIALRVLKHDSDDAA